ncbi:MAG TPA: hypothetical protein VH044_15830 [Polyangiaceae bacterium]|nr:hypothetical protein [Polyangiaceae bacterium]
MAPRFLSPARLRAGVVVFVALIAVGFLPLFGGPGYEQSLASGLVVPMAAAIAAALEISAFGVEVAPVTCVLRGIATGGLLAAIAFSTALIHGARAGICDFWGGTVFFLLTAAFGGLMGGAWGALVGEVAGRVRRRRLVAVLLAIAGPLGGIVASVGRFYASPMIFSYDPFFGYFSGTLYDTVVDVRPELWTYRAGSVATLAGLVLVAAAVSRSADGKLRLRLSKGEGKARVFLATGLAALAASLAVTLEGSRLGHWQTAASIAETLGGRASGPRCDVVYPDSLFPFQAELLVRDCEEELSADEARLGAHLDGRLTAFIFADANQKRRLMGAAETQIAKPWRREVYVQFAPYPHPVLGHEVAHVVAGTFGHGPFRVGGGLVPNPGLIEGVAVATSPDDDELSDGQWARAMLDLGTLPEVRSLFSLAFLGTSAQKSYTVAGAFVAWMLEERGAGIVRAWYSGQSIEALTGETWAALDAHFRDWLRTLTMPAEAMAYARAKFERPSVWGRRCPHVVDALDRDADKCRDDHRFERADVLYAEALGRDAHDAHAQLARAKIASQSGDPARAERGRMDLAAMAEDTTTPRTWRDRAEEALADADLVRGDADAAVAIYREIAGRTLDEDAARTLEVKALGAADRSSRGGRDVIVDLLLAAPGRAQDPWLGALSVGQWAAETGAPLANYLVGKNLMQHDRWGRAVAFLDRALAQPTPTARIGREVLRQRVIGACVLRDGPALAGLKLAIESDTSPFAGSSGGRRESLLRLLARCDAH